jgi:predicted nucleic acid-binding protein
VDTGAWLAIFHRRDQFHHVAAAELRRLRGLRIPLVVTDLILAEVHLHLLHGVGSRRAADHLATLTFDPLIEEVFVDRSLQSAAMEDWLRRFDDQPFTLADAVSFAVMRKEKIRSAFTFDRHFSIAGFESLPLEVPAGSHLL